MSFDLKFDANPSPTTPARSKGKASTFSQAPSTTPAGPPPSWLTNKSTTPAGPPPRSSKIFGSSYNAANNTFGHRAEGRGTPGRKGGYAVPESSPPQYMDDEDGEYEDDAMEEYTQQDEPTRQSLFGSSFIENVGASPRGLKRNRNGNVRAQQASREMRAVARGLVRGAVPAPLTESDDVVISTEEIVASADAEARELASRKDGDVVSESVAQLTKLWSRNVKAKSKQLGIGPEVNDALTKANYLSSILLQLHHPHTDTPTSAPASTRLQRSLILATPTQSSSVPLAQALLHWLNTYHTPIPDDFDSIHLHQPSPSSHESFWDLIYAETLRGRFSRVIRLLKDAGWNHAATAREDGSETRGYRGLQLDHVEIVIEQCTKVLETCPAIRDDDWNIAGAGWQLYRQRVRHAISNLERYAEGDVDKRQADLLRSQNVFAGDIDLSMSTSTRRAGSKVPWTIYQNLKMLYGQVLGNHDFILDACQDWVEAAVLMTVWWNGDDGAHEHLSRSSLRKSMAGSTREVDVAPLVAYRRRLAEMFQEVTKMEESVFQPDTLDVLQVGLACVMMDDVESVTSIIRTWSQTLTEAVVEVANLSGWLPTSRPSSRGLLQQGFSSEDLMVLSHGPAQQAPGSDGSVDRDHILSEYAEALAGKTELRSGNGQTEKEGWELAISVLRRLDDADVAQSNITRLLDAVQVEGEARVDKVLSICSGMHLTEQGRRIAERYADIIASSDTPSYGAALVYYARGHANAKLKSTLALLTALCLIHSAAVPTQANLDDRLASLLSSERHALVHLARSDPDAATLLSAHLSGYATLRRFYELRDQDVLPESATAIKTKPTLRPLERKREAAKALLAVAESAADCIRGGLFDPDVESVVPVNSTLVLLGEALPLLGRDNRIFTREQIFSLLRIVEDFTTAPGRIRESSEDLLHATMRAFRDGSASTTTSSGIGSGFLKKSHGHLSSASLPSSGSGGLGGSSYDMLVSSSMFGNAEGRGGTTVERVWDWRRGCDGLGEAVLNVGAKDVLLLLRTALVQEVGRAWSGMIRW